MVQHNLHGMIHLSHPKMILKIPLQ